MLTGVLLLPLLALLGVFSWLRLPTLVGVRAAREGRSVRL